MKRILILLLFAITLVSCNVPDADEIPSGGETIDGIYVNEEFKLGYNLEKDGFGTQYIGNQVYLIKYTIIGGFISIENFSVEGGNTTALTFEDFTDYIVIGGIAFKKQNS